MDKLKSMIQALRTPEPPMGQGMVNEAAKSMKATPGYREYMIQAQTMGEKPMTLQEYMSKMQVK